MNLEPTFTNPGLKKAGKVVFVLALIFVVVADFFIERHHIYFIWDNWPGFNAAYAIIGSSVTIVFAKLLLSKFLSKKEDHYG